MLEILKQDYSDVHTHVSLQESDTPPDCVIKALEEKDNEYARACREEFWERADLIASDWPKLEQASHTINRVRSRWTAHLEVEYDSTIKEYRPVDQTSLLEVYQTVQKVVPVITEGVSHLALLLKGLDTNSRQWEEIAKREALNFWQISNPSPDLIGDLRASTKADLAQDEILAPTRSENSREVAAELERPRHDS